MKSLLDRARRRSLRCSARARARRPTSPPPDASARRRRRLERSSELAPTSTRPTRCGAVAAPTSWAPRPPTASASSSYAQIGEARAIVFAPNGDLFVAAPSESAPGGANGGPGAIIAALGRRPRRRRRGAPVPHDARRGEDEAERRARPRARRRLPLLHDARPSVWRTPYADGQRAARRGYPRTSSCPPRTRRAAAGRTASRARWAASSSRRAAPTPRAATRRAARSARSATRARCSSSRAGFRNPMYLRCHRTDEVCAAMELGEDLHDGRAREDAHPAPEHELRLSRAATRRAMPIANADGATMLRRRHEGGRVVPAVGHAVRVRLGARRRGRRRIRTPCSSRCTAAPTRRPSWQGAAIVYAPTDPTTHVPVQDWQPFQGGFGPGGSVLDRPSDIAFSPDGRMFIADDESGNIYWMAPTTLAAPAAN